LKASGVGRLPMYFRVGESVSSNEIFFRSFSLSNVGKNDLVSDYNELLLKPPEVTFFDARSQKSYIA
jgi:hypothetical protein